MYEIIQTMTVLGVSQSVQSKRVIKQFKYRFTAQLYKFWHYDNAEPLWKLSHRWEIRKFNKAEPRFVNSYQCANCNNVWLNAWSTPRDDKCSFCREETKPYDSQGSLV